MQFHATLSFWFFPINVLSLHNLKYYCCNCGPLLNNKIMQSIRSRNRLRPRNPLRFFKTGFLKQLFQCEFHIFHSFPEMFWFMIYHTIYPFTFSYRLWFIIIHLIEYHNAIPHPSKCKKEMMNLAVFRLSPLLRFASTSSMFQGLAICYLHYLVILITCK